MQYVWYAVLALIFIYYTVDIVIKRRKTTGVEKIGRMICCVGAMAIIASMFMVKWGVALWILIPLGPLLYYFGMSIISRIEVQRAYQRGLALFESVNRSTDN